MQLAENAHFALQTSEVDSLLWKKLQDFKSETIYEQSKQYVPHGAAYLRVVINYLENT